MSSTTVAAAAGAAARSLNHRSVHLKIHPVPQTFAARREVLRVIERFGAVEMFKSLKVCFTSFHHVSCLQLFAVGNTL